MPVSEKVIDISKALEISGWMESSELQWLAEQASTHECIVELGSFQGRSTRALADHTPGKVYAIDRWQVMPYMPPTWSNEMLLGMFEANLNDHILSGKVEMIVGDHSEFYKFPPEWVRSRIKPDMVFIDGGHHYEEVKRDILAWQTRLTPGGLLCGHDAESADWPDVDRAVAELLPGSQVAPGTKIWWIQC